MRTIDAMSTTPASTATPGCADCAADHEHCHEASLEHADGTTECVAACSLPHHLHVWQLSCSALAPPCPCATDEAVPPLALPELQAA